MVKPEELRPGNILFKQNEGDDKIIRQISIHGILRLIEDGYSEVPITDEWLLKLGFEKKRYCFVLLPLEIEFINNKYFNYFGKGEDLEIKTVHQLQNLYFAMTGVDLRLK